MKNLKTIMAGISALMLLMLGAVQPAMAQDDAKHMRMVSIIDLDPSQEKHWNAAWESIVAMAAESEYPYSEFVGSHRNQRFIITSLSNFADVDGMIAARNAVAEAQGDKFQEAIAAMDAAEITSQSFFSRHDPELSYYPEGDAPEAYAEIETYYYRAGKTDEMKAVIADFKALAAEVEAPNGFGVFWNNIGSEGSSVTIVSTGENAIDLAQESDVNNKLMGTQEEKMGEIFGRFLAISLSSETQHMTYKPEWSINQ